MENNSRIYYELCNSLEKFLVSEGYSCNTIKAHKKWWRRLGAFLKEKGKVSYNALDGLEFLHREIDYPEILKTSPLSRENRTLIRAVRLLNEYNDFQRIPSKLKSGISDWDDDIKHVYDGYHNYCENTFRAKSTVKIRLTAVNHFINNAITNESIRFSDLTEKDIAIIIGQEIKGEINIKTIDEVPTSIKPKENEEPREGKKIRGKRGPYKKKPKPIIETETNDYCFPFKSGKCLLSDDASDNKLKQYMNTIFRTNTYVTDSNGNKKKEKKQRKFKPDDIRKKIKVRKPDDIRKKIKVRFHKKIKNIINENLKKAGSTELFGFLPQYFISNIAKKFNNQFMNMTYEQLLKINFSELQDDYPNKACDNKQYEKNKDTLEYLDKNPEISKISGFDKVKKMKYRDIFKAYFSSAEFEESIEILKEEENESAEYIQEYFILAKNYIDYFINIDD